MMQQNKPNNAGSNSQDNYQYVGPYKLEKTLGKGQTGKLNMFLSHHRPNEQTIMDILYESTSDR